MIVDLIAGAALIVGSATLNNNMLPSVADILTYLKGLKPLNLVGAVFGSYGWSGEATVHVKKILEGMDVELVDDILKVKFVPDGEVLDRCHALGEAVALRLTGEKE